jgi:hypothetical protein
MRSKTPPVASRTSSGPDVAGASVSHGIVVFSAAAAQPALIRGTVAHFAKCPVLALAHANTNPTDCGPSGSRSAALLIASIRSTDLLDYNE